MSLSLGSITSSWPSTDAGFRPRRWNAFGLEAMVLFGLNGVLLFATPLNFELVRMVQRCERNQVISFGVEIIEARCMGTAFI